MARRADGAFNSLSRDHTAERIASMVRAKSSFQLPLSGSLCPSRPRQKLMRIAHFQLPLSGSLGISTINVFMHDALFQLPLSGSHKYVISPRHAEAAKLSTPSLGITRAL